MRYIEEFFSVSFESEDKIENNPVPYGKLCRTSTEKTRYVGIARIQRIEPQDYRLEEVVVVILPGKDKVTPARRRKIMAYVSLWMPSKCMVYNIEEIIEDMLTF